LKILFIFIEFSEKKVLLLQNIQFTLTKKKQRLLHKEQTEREYDFIWYLDYNNFYSIVQCLYSLYSTIHITVQIVQLYYTIVISITSYNNC